MTKFKKSLFGVAALAGIISPVALAASCTDTDTKTPDPNTSGGDTGNKDNQGSTTNTKTYYEYANNLKSALSNRLDANSINTVKVGVNFSKDREQWNAILAVIDRFNSLSNEYKSRKTELDAKKATGTLTDEETAELAKIDDFLKYYKTVELINLGSGGYNAGAQYVNDKLTAKNTNELFSIILNYPVVASNLASKGMLLNFDSENANLSNKLTNFKSEFTKANNGNTSYVSNPGTWVVPALLSGNVLGVNAPVMSYILETMESKGAKINLSDYDAIKEQGKNDRNAVKKLWGEPESSVNLSGYTVDQSTFSSAQKLFEFANKAKTLFSISKDRNSNVHVLGIDDAAGFIETLAYSSVGADDDKFLVKVVTKDDTILADYESIKDENSQIGKNMVAIYDALKGAIATGAVVIQADGVYSSTDGNKNHKYALNVGSSAGYYQSFVSGNKTTSELSIKLNVKEFVPVKYFKVFSKTEGDKSYVKTDKKYNTNGIYSPDDIPSYVQAKDDRYNYYANDDTAKSSLASYLEKLKSNTEPSDNFIVFTVDPKDKHLAELKNLTSTKSDTFVYLGQYRTDRTASSTNTIYELFGTIKKMDESLGGIITRGSESVLNRNELFAFSAPSQWKPTDPHVVYTQGPSLIGIHTNEAVDNATRLFVKFLLSNDKYTFNVKNVGQNAGTTEKSGTPMDIVSSSGSYIFPVNGFENQDFSKETNVYLKRAKQDFANVIKQGDVYHAFAEIGDPNANIFRQQFKTAFINLNNNIVNSSNGTVSGSSYRRDIIDSIVTGAQAIFQK
ncbi:P68 family surface lipoprotein [Mycoplasmopsis meleagridis]|uniref:P68 family surface lipoprotein n=1 Tax=Mycoplasmopsis meleagridis TaxID=29561 RepID=UPI00073DA305|nr:P80 family lipoprotein [Mycoplasmopsis meleagridis]KUH47462.1 hypothetical protein ASB56_01180 [Mycoplasmopsis meleagridis]